MSLNPITASQLQRLSAVASFIGVDASNNVGAIAPFCCLKTIQIVNTTDLDTVEAPGLYSFSGNCPNSPLSTSSSTAGLIMFVFEHSPGYIQQLVFAMRIANPAIYCRRREGASAPWSGWYENKFTPVIFGGG